MKACPAILATLVLSWVAALPSVARANQGSGVRRDGNHSSRSRIWIRDGKGLRKVSVHTFRAIYGVKWTGRQLLRSGLTKANLGYADGPQAFDWQHPDAEPRVDQKYVPSAAERHVIRGETAPLYIGHVSRTVGSGLFARDAIPKGAVIGEYTGVARPLDRSRDARNGYTFVYDPFSSFFMVVDAKDRGNYLRFANHSDKHANAYSKMVYDAGNRRWHTLLVAKQRIEKDDQILFNYGPAYDWGRFGVCPVELTPR